MLKKTITFPSYFSPEENTTGEQDMITEDFYFNLNKVEIAELEISEKGGLAEWLKEIVASNNNAEILAKFKEIVKKSYGVRTNDGRRFIKSPELWAEFEQTMAFEALFFELMTDSAAAAEFVVGIVPSDIATKVDPKKQLPVTAKVLEKKTVDEYTDDELFNMPQDQFDKLVGVIPLKWSKRILLLAFQRETS